MKSLRMTLVLMVSAGLVRAQTVEVSGNTKLNTDFSKYKTYSWAKADATAPGEAYEVYSYSEELTASKKSGLEKTRVKKGVKEHPKKYVYSYNVIVPSSNPAINSTIQNALGEELDGRGYAFSSNPDLLVAYRVFDRNTRLKGYSNDKPTMIGANEIHQPSDTTTFALAPGTLYITLLDAKTSEVVWDGFASGLYQQNEFVSDEAKLKDAVHLILDEFKYRGDKIKVENTN